MFNFAFKPAKMNKPAKNELVAKLICDSGLELRDNSTEIFEIYKKIREIVDRTHIAMGKKRVIKFSTALANSDKHILYVGPSTY